MAPDAGGAVAGGAASSRPRGCGGNGCVADRDLAPVTRDGHPVGLLANVAAAVDAEAAQVAAAAEGVGLLRTEMPFLHGANAGRP